MTSQSCSPVPLDSSRNNQPGEIRLIGTCFTCSRYARCKFPRHRDKRPMEGCRDWKQIKL